MTYLAVISTVTWLLFAAYHGDPSYFTRIFLVWLTYLVLSVLYKKNALYQFWHYNNWFLLIQTFLGLICLVLVAMGMEPLVTAYDLGSEQRPTYFFGISFSNALFGNVVRPAGVFDEPGALACWAVYSLMINYCFIKDKIIERFLPIFTFCTISMAYIIQIAVYAGLKSLTNIWKIGLMALVVAIGISLLEQTEGSDLDLYYYTLRRFEKSDDKGLDGNNRQEQTENALKVWKENPVFGIGGKKNDELRNSASFFIISDNPYEVLAKDGIIGFIVTYLPFFLIVFSKKAKTKDILLAMLVLSIGYLQRPFHINFVHFLYLWGFYLLFLLKNKGVALINDQKSTGLINN